VSKDQFKKQATYIKGDCAVYKEEVLEPLSRKQIEELKVPQTSQQCLC
jgi:hypothetical protein